MTRRTLAVLAIALALVGSPAACSSSGKGSPDASASTTADVQRQLDISRRISQCARAHGFPNFPDPVVDVDEAVFPDTAGLDLKAAMVELQKVPECKALVDQIQALRQPSAPPVSADDMAKLRQFATCIREHGIPDWPDPRTDGTFPISGTPLENEGKSDRFLSAVDACKSIYDKRIATS